MTEDIEHKFLDKLARDMAISIDTEVLYNAMGWTIVPAPTNTFLDHGPVIAWLAAHCGKHHYWDGRIAFEQPQDVTLFKLKWL